LLYSRKVHVNMPQAENIEKLKTNSPAEKTNSSAQEPNSSAEKKNSSVLKSKPSAIYVSIVMPAYNSAVTISESICSVLAQTYPYWELIVIDDASKDDTIKKVTAFQDDRIRILKQPTNQGVAAARNLGVQEARYDWIAFLDSDDLWTKDKLEKQIQQMITLERNLSLQQPSDILSNAYSNDSSFHKTPCGGNMQRPSLYYTGSAFIDAAGHPLSYILHVPSQMTAKEILKQNLVSCSSVLVRRDIMLRHPMPIDRRKPLHEDFATWIGILRAEGLAAGLDEPLLIYRLQKKSKSSNKGKAAMMHWNAMRVNQIPLLTALISMIFYMERGVRKYAKIRRK